MNGPLIYFDNAATSYPKPQCVVRCVRRAFETCGGNPGRSGHRLSIAASQAIFACREALCTLLHFDTPERVIFTQNATGALNLAIHGLAKPGSHILISNFEHNSVIRPVHTLSLDSAKRVTYSVFDASGKTDDDVVAAFKAALRPNTRLAVVTLASNVCGRLLPVSRLSKIAHEHGALFVADAAQAAGEVPLDMETLGVDVLCAAGHKGLLGPVGTGFAILQKGVEPTAFLQGGNGIRSFEPTMSGEMPERLEAGTLNTVGICGLSEGVRFLSQYGVGKIHEHGRALTHFLTEGLQNLGARVYGDYPDKTPVILFDLPGKSGEAVSSYLDGAGVCTRSGFHCAPLAHKALGTGKTGGVRVSLGYANTKKECETFLDVLCQYPKNGDL